MEGREEEAMDKKCPRKLDFNLPLLSTRHPNGITSVEMSNTNSLGVSSDVSDRIPFSWELSPGKPKDMDTNDTDDMVVPPPKPPPGWRHPPIEATKVDHDGDDGCDGDVDDGGGDDDDDDDSDDFFSYAIDMLSLYESMDVVDRAKTVNGLGGGLNLEREECSGNQSPNFMIQRFLPDATALAAASALAVSRNLNRQLGRSSNYQEGYVSRTVGQSDSSSLKGCGFDIFFPWSMKCKPCGVKSPVSRQASLNVKHQQWSTKRKPNYFRISVGKNGCRDHPIFDVCPVGRCKDAKDAAMKEHLVQQWVAIDISIKSQIKDHLLRTLGSSAAEARHTSAQAIAKIASIEIPRKEWPELIGSLLINMTQQNGPASLKQATLETLGYVCEEISHQDLVQDEVNSVLTAVVQGMNVTEHNPEVRLAATRALYNALDFAQTNFENEMERNYIMKVVCETVMAKEAEIRQAAFECLVSIASTYYEVLEPYMQTIFELTSNAVKGDEEAVALQAIEFWSSICDEEIELQDFEVPESGDSSPPHSRFIEKALPSLVPMLLETLLKQEEDQDQDDGIWNLSMAGGTCLGLVARTVGDAIVPHVMPFVEANIMQTDWRSHEAATYAFGSILEGPSIEKLSPMVHSGLDFLLTAMNDENSHVKDTTAWTLSRIFELLHTPSTGFSVISPANLQRVVGVLLESIKDAPHVAEKVCGAIYYLAQGDSKLRSSAYETLNEVVRCSNLTETSHIITQLLPVIMTKLGQTVELQIVSSDDREKQGDLQALLCGVLQVIIQKLGSIDETKPVILQAADQIMLLFLKVFACRSSTVHEEAMLAIGALAYATGPDFGKYMPEFYKYLEMGLQNFEEYQGAAEVCAQMDNSDEEMVEYGNQLRRSIFEAYSGILQGFKDSKPDLMLPHASHLLQFIELVSRDRQREESVTKAAVGSFG
ncbi:hypothetical protein F0562_015203 [Nyssa sinensis]|uniref:Importin N-terminal domain-containing protein n=1 Tax=Nyssa sinensis TaxID=561372 RepID=A0A5J4ZJN2_9ASTE|nr:hypothetical protein F0562_015203 [Nyssa sinensis]